MLFLEISLDDFLLDEVRLHNSQECAMTIRPITHGTRLLVGKYCRHTRQDIIAVPIIPVRLIPHFRLYPRPALWLDSIDVLPSL